jgi:hypothetical protein
LASKHYLPSKIGTYCRRLDLEYARSGRVLLREIINAAHVVVIEETEYDNWNGGTYGHDAKLFLPPEIIGKMSFDEQAQVSQELAKDLNECAKSVANEYFRAAVLELADESDPAFQRAVRLSQQPTANPDTLSIWTPGHLRLFISHRDTHKAGARALGDALSSYGISSFVAHDTIEPMTTWQHEIEKGLETMEVMLAFITDDFHESFWTNQEIGYALGKRVPIISVKFERRDPMGFIGTKQALKGDLDHPERSAMEIYKILVNKLGQQGRLRQNLISAFLTSPTFDETRDRFNRLDETVSSLSDDEVEQIHAAFAANNQLHAAYYLKYYDRLTNFMKRCTGRDFKIDGQTLTTLKSATKKGDMDEEIPF